jgi:ABC-type iron transport system FetAB ATPase subunit
MSGLWLDGIRSRALGPLDLRVAAGELVFLSGESGSGKSLLLRALADLDPHEGEVWLGEEPRSGMSAPVWRQRVGLLPAEAFWWAESVGEHLPDASEPDEDRGKAGGRSGFSSLLPPAVLRLSRPFLRAPLKRSDQPQPPNPTIVAGWLDELGFDPDVLGWSVSRLSTGERQRLALVRLLAQTPEALLLDEATANLDPSNGERVEALVESYRQSHEAAVLWVSHDPDQRRRLGARALVIRDERLEPEG